MKKKLVCGLLLGSMLLMASGIQVMADEGTVETNFFKVNYSGDWQYEEDYFYNNDGYGEVTFFIGTGTYDNTTSVKILAEKEHSYNFRKDLISRAVDLEAYAAGDVEKIKIGELEYTVTNPGNPIYVYRDEPSGVSISLMVRGETEIPAVEELLNGLSFTLTDEGNVDAPYPWEGVPFEPVLNSQMIGTYTIVPEFVPFKESFTTWDIMCYRFEKVGNAVHVLQDTKLHTYDDSDGSLTYVSTTALEQDTEFISADQNGMLYMSPGIGKIYGMKDGQKAFQSEVNGDLYMHPSGEWGLTSWVNSDTQKVKNQDGILSAEPWVLTGLNDDAARQGIFKTIHELAITNEHVLVGGGLAEGICKVAVYDYDGNLIQTMGGNDFSEPDYIGYITGMVETANGYVAADGNMRDFYFWTKEGTVIGTISAADLFGTNYPWIEDMQLLDDGSILVALTEERTDRSCNELLFFRLTGF